MLDEPVEKTIIRECLQCDKRRPMQFSMFNAAANTFRYDCVCGYRLFQVRVCLAKNINGLTCNGSKWLRHKSSYIDQVNCADCVEKYVRKELERSMEQDTRPSETLPEDYYA